MKQGTLQSIGFDEHKPSLADAQIDLERGSVVCTALEDQYVKALVPEMGYIFGHASLHLVDYTAYWENIRENVRTRINTFLNK